MTSPSGRRRALRVALTGGIGSGKSTVAARLLELGAVVVDADQIAREIVTPGQPALTRIVDRFGPQVLSPDGTLDRAGLAAVVFADPVALADLNAITHPLIAARSQELMDAAPVDAVVVYDMPLLVEQHLTQGWDAIIVVETPLETRLQRLVADRGLSPEDARRRVGAQASDAERRAVADHVLLNDTTRQALLDQVDRLWTHLDGSA